LIIELPYFEKQMVQADGLEKMALSYEKAMIFAENFIIE
jgi:hypothetical protein